MQRTVVEVAADSPLEAVVARGLPGATLVAVRTGDPRTWRVLRADVLLGLIQQHLAVATRPSVVADVLDDVPAVPTVREVGDPVPRSGALHLAADGAPVAWVDSSADMGPVDVGVLPESGPGGGATDEPDAVAAPAATQPRRRTRGGLFGSRRRAAPAAADTPTPPSSTPPRTRPSTSRPPAATPRSSAAAPRPPPAPGSVTAHARVEAPDVAPPAAAVDVVVGLAAERQAGVTGSGMVLPRPATPGDPIALTVQLAAAGCELPQGNHRRVLVDPDDVGGATTSVLVVTPAVDAPTDVMLQVDYSVDDQLVGKAWRALRVQPSTAPPPDEPPPSAGQTAVDLRPRTPVDLTIKVLRGDTPDELLWLATSPLDDVVVPRQQISSRLAAADAKAFALDQIARAEKAVPATVRPTLVGMSRTIARAVPQPVWEVLVQVWRAVRAEGRDRPSVLVATSEAWVPWELASVEPEFVPDPTLLDDDAPPVLGCQVRMGRWVQPGFASAAGVEHTELPPPSELHLSTMAVVHGSYGESFDFAELPEARAECDHLAASFPSIRVEAGLEPMLDLLNERVELPPDRTGPVDVIHIACHGKVDKLDPLRNGIVLDDDVTRLGEQVVAGGSLRGGQPLVFVNACQLATASTELLGNQGGLAAAFLSIGARGYIAPLWSVEDVVARGIAEEVHRLCLRGRVPVGEAVRRARCSFVEDPTSATPLAYVYYGHPDLVMATD